MAINFFPAEYEVIRNADRCIACRVCERQCANEVHHYDADLQKMISDETNWQAQTITEVYRQAGSGGVLLSSMGTPKEYPVYWDKLLINASQVTNPSIDPLREPMETRIFLGRKKRSDSPR